jgi:hypothetical protein
MPAAKAARRSPTVCPTAGICAGLAVPTGGDRGEYEQSADTEGPPVTSCHVQHPCESNEYGNMKNADFWDIRTQFVLHRRHITSPLQSTAG